MTDLKISYGSFKSMNLPPNILKTIIKKGFKQPTPIQRKCFPILFEGSDLVAMARTGSGKTIAFLIPLLCKLKSHSSKVGARGLILVPTRELAIQIAQVCREFAKFLDLRISLLVGGDPIEEQFTSLLSNPDIIIGTPGRLIHLLEEAASFSLKAVEFLILDEADRLFEMGFQSQITKIFSLLPKSRQSCLFSATLPESVYEFAKAGLNDPVLVRLDSDCKVSEDLDFFFFKTSHNQKEALLLYLLENVIDTEKEATIIFTSTKHHVEYLSEILTAFSFSNKAVHGGLDQEARNIGISEFRSGKVPILIVTDVASRGLDIPFLDNVVNFDFTDKAKLFVHRVGRAGRAGRQGKAYSFITNDDLPYLIDLDTFLGKPIELTPKPDSNFRSSLILGCIPEGILSFVEERIANKLQMSSDLSSFKKVSINAMKMYFKTRSAPATDSFKKAKLLSESTSMSFHPLFSSKINSEVETQLSFLSAIHKFKPSQTIFESMGKKNIKDSSLDAIAKKRKEHDSLIEKRQKKQNPLISKSVIDRKNCADAQFFIPYSTPEAQQAQISKQAYSLFDSSKTALFDVNQDDPLELNRKLNSKKWDKKKGDFVKVRDHSEFSKQTKKAQGPKEQGIFKKWVRKIGLEFPSVGQDEISPSKLSSLPEKKRDFRRKVVGKKPKKPIA